MKPMTSREIILGNLEHRNPPRPGFNFSGDRLSDIVYSGVSAPKAAPKRWVEEEFEYYYDEWGSLWHRMKDGCAGGEILKPALDDWSKLKDFKAPDFDNPERYKDAAKTFGSAEFADKYKVFGLPGWVFSASRYLRKMEIYFMDLIEYREEIDRLHGIVAGMLEKVIVRAAGTGAEAVFYCEDLGVQDRTLVGPEMWRDIYKPHYERLTAAAHQRGMKVFMHSCGYNWALLEDLAKAGVDCFQFDQPSVYENVPLPELLKKYKIALFSPVDIQKVMPTGDRKFIESETVKLIERYKGSLILKNYGDLKGIGVKEDWDNWAYRKALKTAGLAETVSA